MAFNCPIFGVFSAKMAFFMLKIVIFVAEWRLTTEMAPCGWRWRLTDADGALQMQMALTLASEETADNGTKIEAIISVQMGNML